MQASAQILYQLADVHKQFLVGKQWIPVVQGVTAEIKIGEFAVLVGPSGCGKSTTLHMLLGLELPSSGVVKFRDRDIYADSTEDSRSDFRKINIGMIYQQPNWVKSMSVVENVAFPLLLLGHGRDEAHAKALEFLEKVGMVDWGGYHPTELSGGQQQRVALARALVHQPAVLIADEPTGNLDFVAGQEMMQLLTDLNQKHGITIIMVTHDLEYVKYATRVIQMLDGKVVGQHTGKEIENFLKVKRFKRTKNAE